MSGPNSADENTNFIVQFTELTDESVLSEAERKYIAAHREGSFPNGKLGRKSDGSLNLYTIHPRLGPLCAAITLPTDPVALKAKLKEDHDFVEKFKRGAKAESPTEIEVKFEDDSLADLEGSLQGAHKDLARKAEQLSTAKEVGRTNGLTMAILSDEHAPPHFRVRYQGETANFRIKDGEHINGGLKQHHKAIKKWHAVNKQKLIATWDSTRPSDCPVGKYRE